jgi:hypothetical protein
MQRRRRSGRIAKEIAIVLLGTETTGKMFSEETKTVVLSRHGAGIVSRYRFSPDELLTLRLLDSSQEAEIRLVGQIGGEPGRYVYGVAFVDPDPHFWPMDFPEPESFESAGSFVALECSLCHARQNVEQHEIEEDVYNVNGNILRFCADCGSSTPWKKSAAEVGLAPAANTAKPPFRLPSSSPASSSVTILGEVVHPSSASPPNPNLNFPPVSPGVRSLKPALEVPALAASSEPLHAASRPPALSEPVSSYSGTSTISEFAALSDVQLADSHASSAVASATAVLDAPAFAAAPPWPKLVLAASKPQEVAATANAPPGSEAQQVAARTLDANGRPINKRRHMRIRVNFSACVRHPQHADEIVECENMSKGGVCFHSLQQYPLDSVIEVAAPFSPGEMALFVPARIRRVEPLSGGKVFRYGVEYIKPPSAAPPI